MFIANVLILMKFERTVWNFHSSLKLFEALSNGMWDTRGSVHQSGNYFTLRFLFWLRKYFSRSMPICAWENGIRKITKNYNFLKISKIAHLHDSQAASDNAFMVNLLDEKTNFKQQFPIIFVAFGWNCFTGEHVVFEGVFHGSFN